MDHNQCQVIVSSERAINLEKDDDADRLNNQGARMSLIGTAPAGAEKSPAGYSEKAKDVESGGRKDESGDKKDMEGKMVDQKKDLKRDGSDKSSGSSKSSSVDSESLDSESLNKQSLQRGETVYAASVGVPVKEGHENYMLMYDMLTGIRISVSRCQAKVPRPIQPSDFKMANKIAFDIMGNELAPSSLYDFKFKDYAPWAFREIRSNFRIDPAEYLLSLTNKYILSERSSPGKSGSFFYYSADYRFIIKTIHRSEYRFLRNFLKSYFEYIFKYPNTLLSRILGLHRVKLPRKRKIHFIVMDSILPLDKNIDELYDLKGSLLGRKVSEDEKNSSPNLCVYKDLNWTERNRKLKLGPVKKESFLKQLDSDVKFLASHDIMDYSLLVGTRSLNKEGCKNDRANYLSVFEPDSEIQKKVDISEESEASRRARVMEFKSVLSRTDPVLINSAPKQKDRLREERINFLFYKDEDGFLSTNPNNSPGDEIYYLGIIDIFTKFGPLKLIESTWKSLRYNKNEISAVKPEFYSQRFFTFIEKSIT